MPGTPLIAWLARFRGSESFNGVPLAGEPATSCAEKWRYWRAKLDAGGRISVTIGAKSDNSVSFALEHGNPQNKATAATWKTYWKQLLADL